MTTNNLPRGCSSVRSVSDIRRHFSGGGGMAYHTNRMYMLSVRRESLGSKKNTLESQLKVIRQQIHAIDEELREAENKYHGVKGRYRKNRRKEKQVDGRSVKEMQMRY